MTSKILVAYATRYGSTQEVAEFVATVLREQGLSVDCSQMPDVQTLEPYPAVVLGAPLYIGRWPKDAQHFLTRHQDALMQRAVACFTLGPTDQEAASWQDVQAQLDQELARYSWLRPMTSQLFGGRYDPAKLRFPDSLLAKLPVSPLHGMPASDVRDWVAIRNWAESLAAQVERVPAV